MIRAKFKVQEITKTTWGNTRVILRPQYDKAIPEDQCFRDATPSGEMWMDVANPAALEQLKLGQTFYVDFTPAEYEGMPQ